MQRFLLTALIILVLMGSLVYGLVGLTTTLSPEELEDAFSQDPYLYYSLGTFLSREGLHDQAESVFEDGLKIEETPKSWYNLGYALNEQDKKEEARTAFENAISLDPDYAKAWYAFGIIAFESDDFVGAVYAFENVVGLTPDDQHAWFDLGLAYTSLFRQGDDTGELALTAFERALELDQDFVEAESNIGVLKRFI